MSTAICSTLLLRLSFLTLLALLSVPTATAFLFGSVEDPSLAPIKALRDERKLQREQLNGWASGNITQMGNWTFSRDPEALRPLLTHLPTSLGTSAASYYNNLTGFYKGDWSASNFTSHLAEVNEDELLADRGTFDWTPPRNSDDGDANLDQSSRLNFNLDQDHILPGKASLLRGSLSLQRPANARRGPQSLDFDLDGIHFVLTGSIFLLAQPTETDTAIDLRSVLSMVPHDEPSLNVTVSAIDKALEQRIERLDSIIESGHYDGGSSGGAPPSLLHNCSLHIYARLNPAGPLHLQTLVDQLESEMIHSTGISTISAPPLGLNATVYSPECQLLLRAPEISGLTKPRLWNKAINYTIVFFIVLLIQTKLLVDQMQTSRTPSGLAKVSYHSFGMQSILDAYIGLAHLSVGIALGNQTTRPLIACAFMCLMLFLAFGYRYALTIFRTQAPEMQQAITPTAAPPPQPVPTQVATGAEQLAPGTVTAPAAEEAETDEQAQVRKRFWFGVGFACVLFFSGFFPILFIRMLAPMLYSFWLPQIWRNIQRGTRRAIQTRCVIGTTLCRLFLPLYILACPSNVLFVEPTSWAWVLVVYVVGQMIVLLIQDLFGPHVLVPASRIPAGAQVQWDWHPPLAAGCHGDCAICLTSIENEEENGEEEDDQHMYPPDKGRGPLLPVAKERVPRWTRIARRWRDRVRPNALRQRRMEVMVAPCKHAFHTACLERWLMIKTECPSCRRPLPPV